MDFSKALSDKGFLKPSPKTHRHRLMLIGPPGSGKTVLLSTLPGPKVGYLFDPNAEPSIPNEITDYTVRSIIPDRKDIDLGISASYKRVGGGPSVPIRVSDKDAKPHIIEDWTKELRDLQAAGFWDELAKQRGWLIVDSLTFLSHYVQAEVFWHQDQAQALDMRQDYQKIGVVMSRICLYLTTLPCHIAFSAHYITRKDEVTHKKEREIDQHGQAPRRIPGMMTDIFTTSAEKVGNGTKFFLTTVADKDDLLARKGLSQRALGDRQDVTIVNWTRLSSSGLAPYFGNSKSD